MEVLGTPCIGWIYNPVELRFRLASMCFCPVWGNQGRRRNAGIRWESLDNLRVYDYTAAAYVVADLPG